MRKLLFAVLVLLVLPVGVLLVLNFTSPVVATRFVDMFISDDGDFTVFAPRVSVLGDGSYVLPLADPDNRTIKAEALVVMRNYAAKYNSYSLIVVHKGIVQMEWYAEGWSRTRLTQSQSMHKSILPILIQAAIEDGSIASVNDPIGTYITEWQDDPRGAIPIEQLMFMSSGLYSPPFSINPFSNDFLWLFGTDVTPILLGMPKEWEAGEKWQYNNINSELLGLIVERAAGKPYASYLSEKVWVPMGADDAELWLDAKGGKAHTSCCLFASTMDWVKFGMLLLERGAVNGKRIVATEFIDRMVTPAPTSDWYGYQIWLNDPAELNPWGQHSKGYQRSEPFITEDVFYTSGFGAQRVFVVPSEELVIVRMGPATGLAPIDSSWDNTFLVNKALRNLH
ncbi:MAG: serine hydrolase [Gammaproteobacteria bacterium]|nr:serine hydrolase [Gammaproteobacteria bacterium]MCP4830593.1 serine hydrolase [Gammaproteobacteria bacterium]MCP4928402.1 serine hydrolase [Gammaproteobacteria bacterium]